MLFRVYLVIDLSSSPVYLFLVPLTLVSRSKKRGGIGPIKKRGGKRGKKNAVKGGRKKGRKRVTKGKSIVAESKAILPKQIAPGSNLEYYLKTI